MTSEWQSVTNFGKYLHGMDTLKELVMQTLNAFPDIKLHIVDTFCEGLLLFYSFLSLSFIFIPEVFSSFVCFVIPRGFFFILLPHPCSTSSVSPDSLLLIPNLQSSPFTFVFSPFFFYSIIFGKFCLFSPSLREWHRWIQDNDASGAHSYTPWLAPSIWKAHWKEAGLVWYTQLLYQKDRWAVEIHGRMEPTRCDHY